MIEKMKFIKITGLVDDLERVKHKYLSKYDIQLEDATKETMSNKLLLHFDEPNIYFDYLKKAERLSNIANIEDEYGTEVSKEDALRIIDEIYNEESEQFRKAQELENERNRLINECEMLKPFVNMSVSMDDLDKMEYIHFRFGKLPRTGYLQLEKYLNMEQLIIFDVCAQDSEYAWGVYYAHVSVAEKADDMFHSIHFEGIWFPSLQGGKPGDTYDKLQEEIKNIDSQIHDISVLEYEIISTRKREVAAAVKKIKELHEFYNMRKYIARTTENSYVLVGWMTERNVAKLEADVANDKEVNLTPYSDLSVVSSKPPTKLKNPKPFQPFEFYVKMYGLPSYNEIDPTIFLAVTYSLLFGIMFGDFGQGFLLSLFGFIWYKAKNVALGAIIGIVGISSMFFGFMYGSFFGYEHVIPTIWMKPMDSINDILIITVAIGVIIIAASMGFHVINAIKAKNIADALFDNNGVAGMVFYGTIIYTIFMVLIGNPIPPLWLLVTIFGLTILIVALKEPLEALINHKKKLIHGTVGDFIVQTFFEMFEVLLSYITNTISFVRVGAFALSHAGMMSVVLMLADAEDGTGNLVIIIIGNLIVMLMEGLVVGIQVLRLEYYEMFSRFFKSNGREFKPFVKSSKKH